MKIDIISLGDTGVSIAKAAAFAGFCAWREVLLQSRVTEADLGHALVTAR